MIYRLLGALLGLACVPELAVCQDVTAEEAAMEELEEPYKQSAVARMGQSTKSRQTTTPQKEFSTQELQRYRHEPSVEVVVRAATLAFARQGEKLTALATRARLRGLIPMLSVSARHGQALDLTTQQAAVTDSLRIGNDRDLTLQAALTFELPRLLFAREEISIARSRRVSMQQRQQLIEQVVSLYFERRRLQLRRDQAPSGDADIHLRILELTALLDAFTDGVFSRMIKSRATRDAAAPKSAPAPSRTQSQ